MRTFATIGAFWEWDRASDAVTWTGALSALFGGGHSSLSMSWDARLALIDSADRPRIQAELARLRGGQLARADLVYSMRSHAGPLIRVIDHVFAVHQEAQAVRLVGSMKPADPPPKETADASLADQLRDAETHFRTFVESLPLLAWEANADGWLSYYNQRWYAYTGTTPAEMEGWGWIRVHNPADLPRMLKVFRNALITGQPWEDEFMLRRADGAFRWHLSRATPLRDVHGRIVRWFGTNTDIHDQKLALQERERLLEAEHRLRVDAENAARAKDEFLALVSHELRSPLSAILGWAQLLRSARVPDSRRDAALEKIETNSRFLAHLIGDLLDVSSIVTGKMTVELVPVRVPTIVEAAIDTVQAAAQAKQVVIQHQASGDIPPILGHEQRLKQVFTNLLSNAVRFSPYGEVISVSTGVNEDQITVRVEDHGEGIEPAFLPHLFEKFTQGDTSPRRRHGGLGLGLAIAKSLTELHGGTIEVVSAGRGEGATFSVRLPAMAAGQTHGTKLYSPPADAAALIGITILAVDDDPEARDLLAAVLLDCGATVTVVDSVASALSALRVGIPDVIVSDLSMPDVDGYGLVERLREATDARVGKIPVVAVTAYASEESKAQALSRGFAAYLTKPLDIPALSRTILATVNRTTIPQTRTTSTRSPLIARAPDSTLG